MMANHKRQQSRAVVIIFMTIVSILFLIPIYLFVNNAFKVAPAISTSPFILTPKTITMGNIVKAFDLMRYLESFRNSVMILVLSCLGLIICSSLAAFAIVVVGGRWMERFYIFVVALITIPIQVAMIPLANQLSKMGLVNTYFGAAFTYIAFGLPFAIFIYVGHMRGIPKELAESARVDGCGYFLTYLWIYVPLMKTVTATVLILRGLYIWNDILVPMITISTSRMATLPQKLVSFEATNTTRWDLMFAAAFLVSLPIISFFLFTQQRFIDGIVEGAVKG
jgi:raffinose/stachyose/melibiose transport system permease protein